jgi:hypothetical protein
MAKLVRKTLADSPITAARRRKLAQERTDSVQPAGIVRVTGGHQARQTDPQ